jgi:hypothetical protein
MIHNPYVKRQEFEKLLKSIPDPPSLDSYQPKPGQTFLESLFEEEKKPMPEMSTTITLIPIAAHAFIIEACNVEDKSNAVVTLHHEEGGDHWTVEFPPKNSVDREGVSVAVTFKFTKKEVDDLLIKNVRDALKDEGAGASVITYQYAPEAGVPEKEHELETITIELKGRAR